MPEILITVSSKDYRAELTHTPTAEKLWDALPIEGLANLWGKEIYFGIPISAAQEPEAREVVEVGTIAYWPVGKAFCIFFGPTPVSMGDQPRAYSPVNILGRIEGDLSALEDVRQGETVRLRKAER